MAFDFAGEAYGADNSDYYLPKDTSPLQTAVAIMLVNEFKSPHFGPQLYVIGFRIADLEAFAAFSRLCWEALDSYRDLAFAIEFGSCESAKIKAAIELVKKVEIRDHQQF